MELNSDFIKKYHSQKTRHEFYKQSVELADDLLIHFDGKFPGKLITERRPSESPKTKDYRESIYICPTEGACSKIQKSLMKGRKSPDWKIDFKESNSLIRDEESFSNYMEYKFPNFNSFTNWFFQSGMKTYLTDANAVILVMPINIGEIFVDEYYQEDNQYLKPYPFQFKSEQIIDYYYGNWYLLKSTVKSKMVENGYNSEGDIYYYVDTERIALIKQVDMGGNFTITQFEHKLGYCPVIHYGGMIKDDNEKVILFKSQISPIVPFFKEAVREYSDLQAEIVQHMHSTLWAYEGKECKTCKGIGSVAKKDSPPIKCSECGGHGFYPFNPYENIVRNRSKAGESDIKPPFAGFIEKQTEIAKLQSTRIFDHMRTALSAINMEYVIDPPQENQSGTAKEVDRAELNNFVHGIYEDIILIFDKFYKIACDYRYQVIVPNPEERIKLLPEIAVPEKYDIISESYLLAEAKMMKDSKFDSSLISASLTEYVNKKFSADKDFAQTIIAAIQLDPFPCQDENDLLMKLTNGGISKLDYVIHCNIKSFVQKAGEDEKFFALDYPDKLAMITKMGEEFLTTNSNTAEVIPTNV